MDKFKELSLEEMRGVEGGNTGSDFLASVGHYAHEVWCDIKKSIYKSKKMESLRGGESPITLWGF